MKHCYHTILVLLIAINSGPCFAHFQHRPARISIDPGHGGKDPGASLNKYFNEKTIALAIAKQLKHELNKQPMISAKLTRNADHFVSLRRRLSIARQQKADLFVSIHADGFFNKQAHGVSIYTLSEKGATSEASRWLANKENRSDFIGGESLDDKSNLLKKVLIDMQQTATIHKSLVIAQTIIKKVAPNFHLHQSHVEQAAFIVLKSPDIPSILIETGFISNPNEAKKLYQPKYQQHLAHSISQGIQGYFKKHPLEKRPTTVSKHIVIVKPGDTLYNLARDYNISVKKLLRANHLTLKSPIKMGQKLIVPTNKATKKHYPSLGSFIKQMIPS
jgi:N-acetylmuramoyl-L-alanine amidase